MKLKYDGDFTSVNKQSDEYLRIGDGDVSLKGRFDTVSLETDLPVLCKQDSKSRWQEMTFSLSLDHVIGSACVVREIKTPGMKKRRWSSPIKTVGTKFYSDVIQERLIAAHKKKRDRDGWVESKDDVVLGEPQLLHHYDEHKDNIKFPALISPKLNGIRATFKPKVGLISRKRNIFLKLSHLTDELDVLGMSVDGELWHKSLSLEDISSASKNQEDTTLEYHMFDRPQGGTYVVRLATLMRELKNGNYPHLKIVPTVIVQSHDEIAEYFEVIKHFVGVDGAVVRNMHYPYAFDTRSKDVLKVKDVISAEFKVVDTLYDEDIIGHLIKFVFEVKLKDGSVTTFEYSPAWDKKRRHEAHIAQGFIGSIWTLEFREWTKRGIPRHIMDLTERDYE